MYYCPHKELAVILKGLRKSANYIVESILNKT